MATTNPAPATTARASFVVYKDEPSSFARTQRSLSAPPSPVVASSRLSIPTACDKENVDPVTGRRPSIDQQQIDKKRKTGVLATKILITTKSFKETPPEAKKRKIFPTVPKVRVEKKDRKDKRALVPRKDRNVGPSRSSRRAELPRVEEEPGVEEGNKEHVAQALVDARCYELTVSPLADVSEAYSPRSDFPDEIALGSEGVKDAEFKDRSDEGNRESAALTSQEVPPHSPNRAQSVPIFSTPERKRIYSAFTFSSPSPAGKRFAATRESGLDTFSDHLDPAFEHAL